MRVSLVGVSCVGTTTIGRILYLEEIKADISYFKRSYERADLQVTITGLDPEASAAAIDARLGRT